MKRALSFASARARRGLCVIGLLAAVIVGLTPAAWGQGPGPGPGSAAGSGSGPAAGSGPASGSGPAAGPGSGSGSGSGPRQPKKIAIVIPVDIQVPEVSAAASPTQIRLGDRFTLFITATFAASVEVNLAEPVDLGDAFEVRRKVSQDRTAPDGRRVREWQLEVYAWELGELRVPELGVTFTSQGKAGQIATNTVPINVSGLLGDVSPDDPKLMRGHAPPVRLLARDWFWLWLVGGIGAVAAGVWTFLVVRRRRRRRVRTWIGTLVPTMTTPRHVDMTGERALQRLLAIERSGVLDRDGDRKHGYTEMVDVIRDYLGARYQVATLDLTSAELLRALAKTAPAVELELVDEWLERCDIVKYGGLRATAGDAHGVLDGARNVILATTRDVSKEAAA